MNKYMSSSSTILNNKKNVENAIKTNLVAQKTIEGNKNTKNEEIYSEIKKNLLRLEKVFLDNVLLQVKKKTTAGTKNSIEKSAINELNKYKKNIELLKSKVSIEDNTDKIVKLENKLKENEEILQKLNNDKEGLENISKQQLKAIDEICLNETQLSIQTKYEEIRQLKEELMKLKNTYMENENILKKKQEQLVNIDSQLKKKIFAIKNAKSSNNGTNVNANSSNVSTVNNTKSISNYQIQTLKAQIDMINDNINADAQSYEEKISELESNIKSSENDIEFLNSQIAEIKKNIENVTLEIKKMRKQKK
ncbi:conserved Plasmodium protein, unknown function [Plasmodium knowlesi strain H]|uniref:Uncharacterized protein n=3 Tax=Plasmodium knowlesi TaxID=5850 RepID=A0A5K1US75_PLAKH|nr:conserved Plasmodium protein, unknown function [Plasmodium knowlesi strain H]OTN67796.1 Uncharacterized protein PKNOH_S05393400 [Plasmodium knowlesi]CAA9990521.1 conserved Plasmodium protein, unknown function [Plasmodium knowlesi strain H]SBO19762.1 conserved Plasmodium protein, unknown function [Plasmodium knowlesi strain H]SBO22438.1 conserved Plasmodium protein, unknown function [Plasmodium knowlesi strain H]VVS79995.1 conserved Plasmodium protein, unknown function [Plasmodium knowlesi s|eukprot:XP_002260909.1 hypothetical protein, conserved in Plasmodium species [Plasmodium knowlesi strain H]